MFLAGIVATPMRDNPPNSPEELQTTNARSALVSARLVQVVEGLLNWFACLSWVACPSSPSLQLSLADRPFCFAVCGCMDFYVQQGMFWLVQQYILSVSNR